MRSSLVLALLPLLAALAQQLLGVSVLDPMQARARERYVVVSRADQLDLLARLEARARPAVALQMARELRPTDPSLAMVLEACGVDAARCRKAKGPSRWRQAVWRAAALRVGVAVCAGVVFLLAGGVLTRRAWGRQRLALGLALAGTLLGLGGTVRQIQGGLRASDAAWREAQHDALITRARLALFLPPAGQHAELGAIGDQLVAPGAAYQRALAACTAARGCPRDRVLIALGRLYGEPVLSPPRSWLDRWLLWIGASLLLLVPIARTRKRGTSPPLS